MMKKLLGILLVLAMLVCGCSSPKGKEQEVDLSGYFVGDEFDVPAPGDYDLDEVMQEGREAVPNFSVRLFQEVVNPEENVMISPVSIAYAYGMAYNGAMGETLRQMQDVMGMAGPALNIYLHVYQNQIPENKKAEMQIANSIWFKDCDEFEVRDFYIEQNKNCYDADVFEKPFNEKTLGEINDWVKKKTDGKIKNALDEISDDASLFLINALNFDAEWEEPYKEHAVREDVFTMEDGTEAMADMMFSEEYEYLECEGATGFMKYYDSKDYAFVALLPNEGITVEEFVNSLSGEMLRKTIENSSEATVWTSIPKFESECSLQLKDALINMGMVDAFSEKDADLTGAAEVENGNLFVSDILHKTYISVDEKGTEAGAVTIVEGDAGADMDEPKKVYLNRPFVYMIIDCQENLPVFIGTVMTVE